MPARLYVSGSTSSTPLSAKQGQWVQMKIHPTKGGLYYEKASASNSVPDGIIYKNPLSRFGGQTAQTTFAKPWNENGLAVPAYTVFDHATTNEELGRFTLLMDKFVVEVDSDGYTGSVTKGDDLILDVSNPGKLKSGGKPYTGAQPILARALNSADASNDDILKYKSMIGA